MFEDASAVATVAANEKQAVKLTPVASEAPGMPGAGLGTGPDPGANGGTGGGVKPKTIAVIAGAGLTAISLGVGIFFGLEHASAESDADDLRTKAVSAVGKNGCSVNPNAAECVALKDKIDEAQSSGTLSTVGFIGAGLFGAATVATLLLWPDDSSSEATSVRSRSARYSRRLLLAPALGPVTGLALTGQF